MNYYNEFDPYCCEWTENLMIGEEIPYGKIDSRSIVEVKAKDVEGCTQAHFFSGIAGWSLALRLAGWAETEEVWTGSCPCQPFSAAGKGEAEDDSRHLWPEMYRIIRERAQSSRGPVPTIFGEQVASKAGRVWFSGVRTDLEKLGYRVGVCDIGAASVGAPHIRQRLYWVADSSKSQLRQIPSAGKQSADKQNGGVSRLAESDERGRGRGRDGDSAWNSGEVQAEGRGTIGRMAHDDDERFKIGGQGWPKSEGIPFAPSLGAWSDFSILACTDGKFRRTGSGIFPLAYGLPRSLGSMQPELQALAALAGLDASSLKKAKTNRLHRLKGYGNAIVPQLAAEFIMAYMETRKDMALLGNLI